MDFKTVELKMSAEVSANMEERGVREEDVREVLEYAESTGRKLYTEGENRFLARKRIGNYSAYVEYILDGGGVEIMDVYSHMVKLAADAE